jgi:hypothetical protein
MSVHDQSYTNILCYTTVKHSHKTCKIEDKKEKKETKTVPVVGYNSVSVPLGLYCKVRRSVKRRTDLGYGNVAEFVAEVIRAKLTALGETKP